MAVQSKYFCTLRTCRSAAEIRLLILNGGRGPKKRNRPRRREREKDKEDSSHVEDAMTSHPEPECEVEAGDSPCYPEEHRGKVFAADTESLQLGMEELIDQLLQLQVETKSSHPMAPAEDPSSLILPLVPRLEPLLIPSPSPSSTESADLEDVVVAGKDVGPSPVAEDLLVGPVAAPPPHGTHRLQRFDPWDQVTGMERFLKAPMEPTTLSGQVYAERTVYRWVNPGSDFMRFPGAEKQEGKWRSSAGKGTRPNLPGSGRKRRPNIRLSTRPTTGKTEWSRPRPEPGLYAEVFVNRRDVESHLLEGHPDRDLYPGDIVTYTRHFGEKGWFALDVHKKKKPGSAPDQGADPADPIIYKMLNNTGDRTEPCSTPPETLFRLDVTMGEEYKIQVFDAETQNLLKTALKEPSSVDLEKVANVIVEQSLRDAMFSKEAGKMCYTIIQAESKESGRSVFRSSLLNRLQSEYQNREELRARSVQEWVCYVSFICNIFDYLRVNNMPMLALVNPVYDCLFQLAQPDSLQREEEV
ncbi:unnamed protein product [Ranitomeya imitator]|uniref:Uncharacterized protein n=1 Tax=Ranitomeya imitator TaxID=111125 RepID=A0ABN9LTK7_9NEOB|nr:unnamed protein product [Ranitomeya imitator]